MRNTYTRWTKEETEYLKDNWGEIDIETLSETLDKTVSSIKTKVIRLKLGPANAAQGLYTAREFADCLGVSHATILNWINKYNMPATKKKICLKEKVWQIDIEKVRRWAKVNKLDRLEQII